MRYLLLSATALALLCANNVAFAQRASSSSSAQVSTRSAATSRSAAVGNTVNINTGTDPSTGSGDPSSYQYVGYGGSYTVHNVPEVIPPSIVGGNPCAVGASGGLAVSGFGISGGATWADKQCERRQQAALMFNMNQPQVAFELMCQDDNVHAAMLAAGKVCTGDKPAVAAAAPVTTVIPAAAPVPAAAPAPVAPPAKVRPEWCYTAGPAELRSHPECVVHS